MEGKAHWAEVSCSHSAATTWRGCRSRGSLCNAWIRRKNFALNSMNATMQPSLLGGGGHQVLEQQLERNADLPDSTLNYGRPEKTGIQKVLVTPPGACV